MAEKDVAEPTKSAGEMRTLVHKAIQILCNHIGERRAGGRGVLKYYKVPIMLVGVNTFVTGVNASQDSLGKIVTAQLNLNMSSSLT